MLRQARRGAEACGIHGTSALGAAAREKPREKQQIRYRTWVSALKTQLGHVTAGPPFPDAPRHQLVPNSAASTAFHRSLLGSVCVLTSTRHVAPPAVCGRTAARDTGSIYSHGNRSKTIPSTFCGVYDRSRSGRRMEFIIRS
ncbi:hypothetical protein ALC60_05020 [Trachymyrmex zeteki]|uniref:Uncharacterized protein n=1 Tax=Mycetomoellerius zeteki TaxID=64791 RepID=A0A151X6P5_9HYME|nr:hypothetical protein ALC60_05020 [Trachymyrmex zeteki]